MPLSAVPGTRERRLHSAGTTEEGSAVHDPPSGRPLCGDVTPFRSDVTRSAFLQILEALEDVHDLGATHGRLEPANIMWFSADCTWKLIDLKGGSTAGDWTLVDAAVGKYSAPEIRYAERLGRQRVQLDPPADMWSFGVIALETLTGASLSFSLSFRGVLFQRHRPGRTFVDSSSVQRCIVDDVWVSNLDADHDDRWLFADPCGRHGGSDEQRYNRFVRKLVSRSPKHRITATDALGDTLFRNVEDAEQRSDSLVQVRFISLPIAPFSSLFLCRGRTTLFTRIPFSWRWSAHSCGWTSRRRSSRTAVRQTSHSTRGKDTVPTQKTTKKSQARPSTC